MVCFAVLVASCAHANLSPLPAAPAQASAAGKRPASFTSLFSFNGSNGKVPYAALIAESATLLGTTYGGGDADEGTVFTIKTPGNSQSVIYPFKGGKDGALPQAALLDAGGTLYGTTVNGGGSGDEGTVFAIAASGKESVLHRFTGYTDGANPYAGLIEVGGTFYGTTAGGGTHSAGTVYTISPSGSESVIYSFGARYTDGSTPVAPLVNAGGTLYGTTAYGGESYRSKHCSSSGCGSIFKITASGAETIVYSFAGGKNGSMPMAALTNVGGTLYGTTSAGGTSNDGIVFKFAGANKETVLHTFKGGSDGAMPSSALTNVNGTLYGTTSAGGSSDEGTIFKITTAGKETVLYSFTGDDGAIPEGGLVYSGGTLYGTTAAGGANGEGTIFSIAP